MSETTPAEQAAEQNVQVEEKTEVVATPVTTDAEQAKGAVEVPEENVSE